MFLSLSEFNGEFLQKSNLRYRYYLEPIVTALEPDRSFFHKGQQVVLEGANFLNFKDLRVRAIGAEFGRVEMEWGEGEMRFMDTNHLLIEMKTFLKAGRQGREREVKFEISMNRGADWLTNPGSELPSFLFLDEPGVVSISQKWSNLQGEFYLTLEILHSSYREDCLEPALMPECARPTDVAYCVIASVENPLIYINQTHAKCLVPP